MSKLVFSASVLLSFLASSCAAPFGSQAGVITVEHCLPGRDEPSPDLLGRLAAEPAKVKRTPSIVVDHQWGVPGGLPMKFSIDVNVPGLPGASKVGDGLADVARQSDRMADNFVRMWIPSFCMMCVVATIMFFMLRAMRALRETIAKAWPSL
jgi:hypothetical protein